MNAFPGLGDETSLRQAFSLFRTNGLIAIGIYCIVHIAGLAIDLETVGEAGRLRYAVMASLPLLWSGAMAGGALVIHSFSIRLRMKRRPAARSAMIGFDEAISIALGVGGTGLMLSCLATASLVSYLAIDSGIVL